MWCISFIQFFFLNITFIFARINVTLCAIFICFLFSFPFSSFFFMLNQGEVGMQGPPGGPGPVGPKVIFQKQNKILLKP